MVLVWERIPSPARQRLVWTLWCITWLLLLAGLIDPACYPYVVGFSAAHALLFLVLFAGRITPFPVQVRLAYLLWVAAGTYLPGLAILLYITTLGLFTNLFFAYCPLARLMSLMPWNRAEPFSTGLLIRTFCSPPSRGRFTPPPAH